MKINTSLTAWFISFIISSFIFFWDIKYFIPSNSLVGNSYLTSIENSGINYNLRYNILLLLIPLIFSEFKKLKDNFKLYIINLIYKNKTVIFFLIFLFSHLCFVN